MYYFVSDIHLGAGTPEQARRTEDAFCRWLDEVGHDARAIYLMGDIFDFWFEYRRVVPQGFTRVLARFAELTRRGVDVVLITGNHDMWCYDYFERECGIKVFKTSQVVEIYGKRFHLAHGDNLNIGDKTMLRAMNAFFRSSVARWLFRWLVHPDLALRFGQWWSGKSRKSHGVVQSATVLQPLIDFAVEYGKEQKVDYFVFGHMHYPADVAAEQRILFMGDWHSQPNYLALDNEGKIELKK